MTTPGRLTCGLALAFTAAFGRALESAPGSCAISTSPVTFGIYDVFSSAPTDSTGTIVFSCNGAAHNVSVSLTKGAAPTFTPRTMSDGADTLMYNLYMDAARSTIWGDGSGGTQVYTDVNPPNSQNVSVPIYGRVPPGQDVRAGTYTDSVTAIINF